jgi:hypothetical protein
MALVALPVIPIYQKPCKQIEDKTTLQKVNKKKFNLYGRRIIRTQYFQSFKVPQAQIHFLFTGKQADYSGFPI